MLQGSEAGADGKGDRCGRDVPPTPWKAHGGSGWPMRHVRCRIGGEWLAGQRALSRRGLSRREPECDRAIVEVLNCPGSLWRGSGGSHVVSSHIVGQGRIKVDVARPRWPSLAVAGGVLHAPLSHAERERSSNHPMASPKDWQTSYLGRISDRSPRKSPRLQRDREGWRPALSLRLRQS